MKNRDLPRDGETPRGGGVTAAIRIGVDPGGPFTDPVAAGDNTHETHGGPAIEERETAMFGGRGERQ